MLLTLVSFRQDALVGELVAKMQKGLRSSGAGSSAIGAAEAFDANLDLAVKAGWAYVHTMLFKNFIEVGFENFSWFLLYGAHGKLFQ
jgi:hypothetical protein